MSAKTIFAAALVLTALGFGAARGQSPYSSGGTLDTLPDSSGSMPGRTSADLGTPPGPAPAAPGAPRGLSPYITYQRPDCCGPLGGGPIFTELYARTGVSFTVGGGVFGRVLDPGWVVAGGGRSLFFDSSMDAAWAVDLGINNAWNHANRSDVRVPLSILVPSSNLFGGGATRVNFGSGGVPGVTVSSLNRTYVNVGFGREWYFMDCANAEGPRWRAGVDVGGRYGTERLELNEIAHRTDTIAGIYVAVHGDVEVPCCSVVFLAGLRAEWAYTWGDPLQEHTNGDVQEINVLLTAGVRF